jgi:hypothetical protein
LKSGGFARSFGSESDPLEAEVGWQLLDVSKVGYECHPWRLTVSQRELRDVSNFSLTFENSLDDFLRFTEQNGAGDEARTRNIQLGKLTLYH